MCSGLCKLRHGELVRCGLLEDAKGGGVAAKDGGRTQKSHFTVQPLSETPLPSGSRNSGENTVTLHFVCFTALLCGCENTVYRVSQHFLPLVIEMSKWLVLVVCVL